VDGHEGDDARSREGSLGAGWIDRQRGPPLVLAEAEDALQVLGLEARQVDLTMLPDAARPVRRLGRSRAPRREPDRASPP
jgi:hypothetical protein